MTPNPIEYSICCGRERSYVYPRDCSHCGGLFIAKKNGDRKFRAIQAQFHSGFWKKLFCLHDWTYFSPAVGGYAVKCVKCGEDTITKELPIEPI